MSNKKLMRAVLIVAAVLLFFASLFARLFSGWPQVLHEVCWGWTRFLARVLPEVNVRWDGVAFFMVGSFLFGCAMHWIAGWIYLHRQQVTPDPRKWKMKWTVVSVLTIELLFVAGIAATGVTHQLGWMITDDQPLFGKSKATDSAVVHKYHTANQMKMQALAAQNFHDTRKRFPMNSDKHGWVTESLPYGGYGYYDMIDMNQAWNSQRNSEWSKNIHPDFINPRIVTDRFHDDEGYGLSHFPGNANIFASEKPVRYKHLESSENTLLFAEKGSNFSPWASPENVRDVRAPLNSPSGFGEVRSGEIIAAFADGSVRYINTGIEPEIFRSFAGPKKSKKK